MKKDTSIKLRDNIHNFTKVEYQKIKSINKALTIAEDSGESISFDNEKFKKRMRKKFNYLY